MWNTQLARQPGLVLLLDNRCMLPLQMQCTLKCQINGGEPYKQGGRKKFQNLINGRLK